MNLFRQGNNILTRNIEKIKSSHSENKIYQPISINSLIRKKRNKIKNKKLNLINEENLNMSYANYHSISKAYFSKHTLSRNENGVKSLSNNSFDILSKNDEINGDAKILCSSAIQDDQLNSNNSNIFDNLDSNDANNQRNSHFENEKLLKIGPNNIPCAYNLYQSSNSMHQSNENIIDSAISKSAKINGSNYYNISNNDNYNDNHNSNYNRKIRAGVKEANACKVQLNRKSKSNNTINTKNFKIQKLKASQNDKKEKIIFNNNLFKLRSYSVNLNCNFYNNGYFNFNNFVDHNPNEKFSQFLDPSFFIINKYVDEINAYNAKNITLLLNNFNIFFSTKKSQVENFLSVSFFNFLNGVENNISNLPSCFAL